MYFCFFQIMFEGTAGNSFTGDIAIDSVKINKGGCPGKNVYVKYIVDMVPAEDEWALFSHRKKTRRDEYGGSQNKTARVRFIAHHSQLSYNCILDLGSSWWRGEGGGGRGAILCFFVPFLFVYNCDTCATCDTSYTMHEPAIWKLGFRLV